MSGSVSAGSLSVNLSAESAQLTRDMDVAARAVENGTARMNRAATQVEALNTSMVRQSQVAAQASQSMDLVSVALQRVSSLAAGTPFGPLVASVTEAGEKFAALQAATAAGEGGLALIAVRAAALASVVIGLPVALQAAGLGINAAGEGAKSAAAFTTQYDNALQALNDQLLTTEQRAGNAAAAINLASQAAANLQGELALGQLFEQRSAVMQEQRDLAAQLTRAQESYAAAVEAADRRGTDSAKAAAAGRLQTLTDLLAKREALSERFARLNEQESGITSRLPLLGNADVRGAVYDMPAHTVTAAAPRPGPAEIDQDMLNAAKAAAEWDKSLASVAKSLDTVMNAIDPGRAALSKYQDQVATLDAAQAAGLITASQYSAELAKATTSYGKAAEDVADKAAKAAGGADASESAFRGLSSSFEQAITSGKSLGDIFKSLTDDLAKLIIKLTITDPLMKSVQSAYKGAGGLDGIFGSLFNGGYKSDGTPTQSTMDGLSQQAAQNTANGIQGFAMGGIMTSDGPLPLRAYANGGIANSPQHAVFGEGDTPEAYVPLPDGRRIPVKMQGGGGGDVYNIDARGADAGVEGRINAVLAQRVPGIIAASRMDLVARVNRGGSDALTFGRR